MKHYKGLLILILLWWQPLISDNQCEIKRLSEVGYFRRFWGTEVVNVFIKCINGKIECKIESKKKEKIENTRLHPIGLNSYLKLWEYIHDNKILNLKSGALNNASLTEEEWDALYGKKIPRQYSYIYDFYFNIGNNKYSFTVDDIGYIKDVRYLEVLNRINKLLNVKTEINIFGDNSKQ